MTAGKPWTPSENAAICALYFAMLDCATAGIPYNKAAMIRVAMGCARPDDRDPSGGWGFAAELTERSKCSIEAKLMNCTACHASLQPDAETMSEHGYRPLARFQSSLRVAMAAALADREFAADCESLVAL